MPFTVTCTTANREIEGNLETFFHLLKMQRYSRFIDPFCGSGSFSFHAMAENIARQYVLNDAFAPIKKLIQLIKSQPEKLLKAYDELCNKNKSFFDEKPSNEVTRHHALAQELISSETSDLRAAAIWLFLGNRFEANRPLFKKNLLIGPFIRLPALTRVELASRVNQLHELLRNRQMQITNGDALEILMQIPDLGPNDCVVLDPPYPECDKPGSTIFYRPEDDAALFNKLEKILELLSSRKVNFILNYGLFWGRENPSSRNFVIDSQKYGLTHLILISHNPQDAEFATLFEHVYVAHALSCNLTRLPPNLYHYETVSSLSYQEACNLVSPSELKAKL